MAPAEEQGERVREKAWGTGCSLHPSQSLPRLTRAYGHQLSLAGAAPPPPAASGTSAAAGSTAGGGVTVRREPLSLLTFAPCQPDPHPMFIEKRVYQGSRQARLLGFVFCFYTRAFLPTRETGCTY